MRIPLIIFLLLPIAPLFSAELPIPQYRRTYTPEQVALLATIKREWDQWEHNMPVKRWNLMEGGINNGLHPDDINDTFLISVLDEQYRGYDPHEAVLHKVQFLLHHNANPNGPPESVLSNLPATPLRMAKTFAIARCLLDHKAQPTPSDAHYTLLHFITNTPHYTTESAKNLIALYCSVDARPDMRNTRGETPLTLLARKNTDYNAYHYRIVADTLVKVGTPIDDAFEEVCIMTKSRKPAAAPLVEAIHNAAYNARKEVAVVKEKLESHRNNTIVALLESTNLSKDTVGIVIDYACNLNPHDYFIQKILTEADAQLQKDRAAREKAREESPCVIL